ncbi:phosphotransferase enzyme family protein [Alkalihalobacterium elongatum]|uniref:phosphotransferase enzyme family protein n=1 Tax=Alkalihalobacterium elongatum TaxID=2675466 RepID=UPI001C1F8CCC|nr:phosphotransferase [Alkalihalobacterium elongatum]
MSNTNQDSWKKNIEKFDKVANNAINFYPENEYTSVKLLNYSENATYLVKNNQTADKQILRVSRPGYHTKSEIESELVWLQFIDRNSPLNVSLPIAGENGKYVQSIQFGKEQFYCTMFTFLEGDAPDENKESDLIRNFESLGEITAHLHDNSIKFCQSAKTLTRLTWDYETILGENPKWGRWQDGLGMTPKREELFEKVSTKIKARLKNFGKDFNRYGLIHSDLRLANLLVDQDEVKVIDFDDCGYGWYLYDLATSLSFIEDKPYVPKLIESWLKGYRKVRFLSQEEEQEIPTFIMMRRLQLVAWVGSRNNETTELLGSTFTVNTDHLAKKYLQNS